MSIHSVRVRALLATCFALVTSVASAQPSANGQGGPACIPNCRAGYVCASGQCVSACNPPCGAGEMCTERAECVANPAAAPAPAPAPVAPPAAAAPVATQAAPGAMQAAPGPGAPAPAWNAPPQPQASAAQPGVRTHDGFYFRLGLGVGALDGSFTLHHHNTVDDSDKDEISGSGVAYLGELALGGSPKPGIVIGGGAY
ncbi:MAG TPA: hypothetical protein VNG33_22525, partial [Polyangiaceae bacterium]|nr:hypothetical protein [Polyangiaceae bacterium]